MPVTSAGAEHIDDERWDRTLTWTQTKLPSIMEQAVADLMRECPDEPLRFLSERLKAEADLAAGSCGASALSSNAASTVKTGAITILHFNDVYEIESRLKEPVGGAARFVTKVKSYAADNPMVIFSGDAFSPSMMSTVTHGKQMVPILNNCNIHTAMFGNHDFDFGVDQLSKLVGGYDGKPGTNFPWLLSNVTDNRTGGKPLAGGMVKRVCMWQGYKVGMMGLIESEWLATLSTIEPEDVTYTDFVERGRQLADDLRYKDGCDLVLAVTHMRVPNDVILCEQVPEIDIVLGGHDHHYECRKINQTWMVKSGTDFRDLSAVKVDMSGPRPYEISVEHVEIKSDTLPDPDTEEVVQSFASKLSQSMDRVVGQTGVELDGRFAEIRTKETNLGNLVTDVMCETLNSDIAILNSGTLRSDDLHGPGDLRLRDLVSILPMMDMVVVIEMTGRQLLEALENGVSQYPKLEGRFPQVSGVHFPFDPKKPAGSRIEAADVRIVVRPNKKMDLEGSEGGEGDSDGLVPLDLERKYSVATKEYLVAGKDGYDVFPKCKLLIDGEEGVALPVMFRQLFRKLAAVKGFVSPSGHLLRAATMLRQGKRLAINDKWSVTPKVEGRIVCLQ